ncbi:hypothetical protein J2Y45_006392 [Dyadobacter sp. BE34]|uniref:DUF3052 domain-containing protein n=1 Tax=Dyadobacter fermentans TaxID=94254 RepID=A0ABU1R6Z6_9BACT|nr:MULTISPECIES: DUF3052 domain-containing protein [Dyadobacter]MDR6809178.1 hypothetical protein [Dyadobacter fermentans]MDR7046921.1 hypothetical protein [Dyadobacter sp. BE242]MDR7201235.1 hypothetical protein [Dyadobacter sp. BE34]MDR7219195.1 hypothetical protein [Dyadobacter sp. BE31]MDR7264595.1 hypothetical protein [Dyadobacter sp. BE32]
MAMQAGYSNTSLVKKLGIKPGFKIRFVDPPEHYFDLLEGLPADIVVFEEPTPGLDFVHYFTKQAASLERDLPAFKQEIVPNGTIWISWPKKASKVPTDVTEDVIRNLAVSIGLVDVKVCAVDTVWSALKLVIRVKDR